MLRAIHSADIANPEATPAGPDQGERGAVHIGRLFAELTELRQLIRHDPAEDAERKMLGEGLTAIHAAINQTRGEIATLHAKAVKGQEFNRAADELDAVVADTESATETILTAAETIDALALDLLRTADAQEAESIEAMRSHAIRIFEACNFQDITGQRISKVVRTLQFIEGRISTMLEIWQSIGGLDEVEGVSDEREGDEALLNGPALLGEENVVSQDDIDSLFP